MTHSNVRHKVNMSSTPTPPSQNFSRSKRILARLLLIIAGVAVTLFALELLVRFLPLPYSSATGELFACHHSLGWIGQPNFNDIYGDGNFRQELVFNTQGMHDSEHTLEEPSDTFRILMLGDSFVHAIQVGETETAHQVLEDYLNDGLDTGQRFEIISSGVVNWGTNQQLIYYREQGRHFQPDLVLLMFYIGNDFLDNLPGNVLTIKGINCYAPYFALCENTLNPDPLTYAPGASRLQNNCSRVRRTLINILGILYQHSRLYQQIEPLIIANWPREQFGQDYPLWFAALYLPNEEPELKQAYHVTQATIVQLQQEIEADGAQFAVALIGPWATIQLAMLSPEEQTVFLSENPAFVEADADRPNRRMIDFLTSQNIPFIDLTPPMIEHLSNDGTPLYFLGEGHWTTTGNRVAADILAQWLIQNDLLPGDAK